MSLVLGMTYEREDGATFVPWSVIDEGEGRGAYLGEMTDARGTRRHAVPVSDHGEWKFKGNERGAPGNFEVRGPAAPEVQVFTDDQRANSVFKGDIFPATKANTEERKAPKKR